MNDVPTELLYKIFGQLDPQTLFNASLTCQKWNMHLSSHLPTLNHMHIDMDSMACEGRILYRDVRDTSTIVCQCDRHALRQGALLQAICQRFGGDLSILMVEDSLLYKTPEEGIHDNCIHLILNSCGDKNLKHLEFHELNLRRVHAWTLVSMARFAALTVVHFRGCTFPAKWDEKILIGILTKSFETLESVAITDCPLISDKFTHSVAKRCPKLRLLNVSGCAEVNTLTAVYFCECLFRRGDDEHVGPIELNLRNTAFNSDELLRYLSNPSLQSWRMQPISLRIGYEQLSILLSNTERPELVIIIHI